MYANQIVEANALAAVVPHLLTAVDTTPWIVIQYVPSLGTNGTAATVAVAAGGVTITFQVNGAAPAGADAIGNSSGQVLTSNSAYSTMGKLVDYINGRAAWRAYLVAALRSNNSAHLDVRTAASCFGANGLTLYSDTSDSKEVGIAISGEKFVNNGKNGHVKDFEDQCVNTMLYAAITVTSASAAVIRYYSGKQGSAEVQIGSDVTLTTATKKEQGEANLAEKFVEAKRGERLIVRAIGTASTAPTVPTVAVLGRTAVLANDRVVTSVNY